MEDSGSQPIVVQVGEKKFTTYRATLAPSALLNALLSTAPPEQEEFFVDADPELFQHVLRYLRTGMFPIFYDVDKGHDTALYMAVQNQAHFFQIEQLETWLAAKRFADAVRTQRRVVYKTFCGDKQIEAGQAEAGGHGGTFTVSSAHESFQKCWVCPNKNWRHYGSRSACSQARCIPANWRDQYAELRVLKLTVVTSVVEVDHDICWPRAAEPAAPPPYNPGRTPEPESEAGMDL